MSNENTHEKQNHVEKYDQQNIDVKKINGKHDGCC